MKLPNIRPRKRDSRHVAGSSRNGISMLFANFRRRRINGRVWLTSLVVLAVLVGTIGGLLRFNIDTTVKAFLPAGDPAAAQLEQVEGKFGSDPIVVLLETKNPQELMSQQELPKLLALEGNLSKVPNVSGVYGPGTVLNQIAGSAQDLLARISGRRDGLRTQAEQGARKEGLSGPAATQAGNLAVQNFDIRYGSLLVRGLPAGLPTLHNPSFAKNVIYDRSGAPRAQWHFVVPNSHSVAVLVRPRPGLDQGDINDLSDHVNSSVKNANFNTSRTTVTGIPVVTSGLANEASKELPLLGGLVVLAMCLRFLLVPARDGWFRRLWPLGAALVGSVLTLAAFGWLGLSMSFGAVALLPLLLGVGSSFPLYLRTAVSTRKVIVVSLASAASFAALAVCSIPFVREIGLALASGIVLTLVVALFLRTKLDVVSPEVERTDKKPSLLLKRLDIHSAPRWVIFTALVLVAAFGWAMLPQLKIDANPEQLAEGVPNLAQAKYAEQVLGSSGQVNIQLAGPNVLSPSALEWSRQAEETIGNRHSDQMQPILTLPDLLHFLGKSPSPEQIAASMQLIPAYLTGAVVNPDQQAGVLTYGLKFEDLGKQTQLLDAVRSELPPPPAGYHAEVAGLPVAADSAYRSVSHERYILNLLGIVAAGVILFLGVRRKDAFRAVLAALLATGWSLAGAWCIGSALSPLTVALGSLTAVTGCEFTVLLVDAYRRRRSVLHRTVLWACLTSCIGYLVLAFSKLWLLWQFGLVLTVTVIFSYLAAMAVVHLLPSIREETHEVDNQPAADGTEVKV